MSRTVKNAVLNFKAERANIRENRELSAEGKAAAEKRLKVNVDTYRPIALATLKSDMGYYRKAYKDLEAERDQATEKAADRWDFKKLQYYSDVVKAKIANAQTEDGVMSKADAIQLIEKEYQASRSDKHLARVWSELGSAALREKYSNDLEAVRLARTMSNDMEALMTTPEIEAVKAKETKMANEIIDLVETAKMAGDFFDHDQPGRLFGAPGDFENLISDVKITTTITPEDPEHYINTRVEILEGDKS